MTYSATHRLTRRTSTTSATRSCSAWRRRCASTSSRRSVRSAATSAPTSAPARSRSRCTRCCDSPKDKILWDVGHQAYPHKVLTGRRDQLQTIRKYEGLAPFCSIARVRARHHGRRPRLDRDRLCGRDQGGDAARPRRGRPRRGGRRRRRDDRRRRVRGGPPGRRRGHADRRAAQRQRDVDRARTSARCRATSTGCA